MGTVTKHFAFMLIILDGHQLDVAPKKAKKDSGAAETVSWIDDEVVVLSYSVPKRITKC